MTNPGEKLGLALGFLPGVLAVRRHAAGHTARGGRIRSAVPVGRARHHRRACRIGPAPRRAQAACRRARCGLNSVLPASPPIIGFPVLMALAMVGPAAHGGVVLGIIPLRDRGSPLPLSRVSGRVLGFGWRASRAPGSSWSLLMRHQRSADRRDRGSVPASAPSSPVPSTTHCPDGSAEACRAGK